MATEDEVIKWARMMRDGKSSQLDSSQVEAVNRVTSTLGSFSSRVRRIIEGKSD